MEQRRAATDSPRQRNMNYSEIELNTSLRDQSVLEVEPPDSDDSKSKPRSAWKKLCAFFRSPEGKDVLRSLACLGVPIVIFYVPACHDWLGKQAYITLVLAVPVSLFATPFYIGVAMGFTLKLLLAICIGQAYGLLVVAVAADSWPAILAFIFVESFIGAYAFLIDFQWGVSLCLAGVIFSFFLIKAQYAVFAQEGQNGWDKRAEVLDYAMNYSRAMLLPSVLGVIIPMAMAILVFPKLLYLELPALLSNKVVKKVGELYDKMLEVYFLPERELIPDKFAALFHESRELFLLADRLPYLQALANSEGAWSFTMKRYQDDILEPILQLCSQVTYFTRVLTRFTAPFYHSPADKLMRADDLVRASTMGHAVGTVSDCVAYSVAKKADAVLSMLSPEEEEKARHIAENFRRKMRPVIEAYTSSTLANLASIRRNLSNFDIPPPVDPNSKEIHDDQDQKIQTIMKETFGPKADPEEISLWFRSKHAFLQSFVVTALRCTHSLSRTCVHNTRNLGKPLDRKILSFQFMRSLLHIIWVTNPTNVRPVDGSILRKKPKGAAGVKRSIGAVLRWCSAMPTLLAVRTAVAVTAVASIGFIPSTAHLFDEISGLIAVGFVLFDCSSPYQGFFLTKLLFRVSGNLLAIVLSLATWYASTSVPRTYQTLVAGVFNMVFAVILTFVARVVAPRSKRSLDLMLFTLYSYISFVGLTDVCFASGVEATRETCDFKQFILQRFYNLLIAILVSALSNTLIFPMRAETAMKKLCGRVLSDIALTYGYVMSSLIYQTSSESQDDDHSDHSKRVDLAWTSSISSLGQTHKLYDLLQYADREQILFPVSENYRHKDFEALIADCNYMSRTLAYTACILQVLTKADTDAGRSTSLPISPKIFAPFQGTRTAALYRKLKTQVFTQMIFCSHSVQTDDVFPPHGLSLDMCQAEIESLIGEMAEIYTEVARKSSFFFHPDHLFIFDIRRVLLILNYLVKDASHHCENLFGTAAFEGRIR